MVEPLKEIKVPVILYDTEGSKVPYIDVKVGEKMPSLLMIFEYQETGEVEPGPEGEEVQIVDQYLHWYADMGILEQNLDEGTFDKVRGALGLPPLAVARKIAAEKKKAAERSKLPSGEGNKQAS